MQQVLEEGRTILVERYADFIVTAFPGVDQSTAREMATLTGMEQAITAPLSSMIRFMAYSSSPELA